MLTRTKSTAIALLTILVAVVFVVKSHAEKNAPPPARNTVQKLMKDGNYKDAYEGYRKILLSKNAETKKSGEDLLQTLQCLQRLNRVNEFDAFREEVIKAQPKNWRLLASAAQSYMNYQHHGYMIAGEFKRGNHRGGGKVVNSQARDRVRALQLYVQAMEITETILKENDGISSAFRSDASNTQLQFAQALLYNRGWRESWKLQYLTNIEELPDFEDGWGNHWRGGSQTRGAPVDEDGNPVYHHVPKSWTEAKTDGERWRYALAQAVKISPSQKNAVRYKFAQFLQSQFGVNTMAQYSWFRSMDESDDDKEASKKETGIFAVHTLKENETIAKLANGVKRFELPDEFNYIKIFQQIVKDDKTGRGPNSIGALAAIFSNRRQYPKAAETWKQAIAKYGVGRNNNRKKQLDQIVKPWGRFENTMTQPAGKGASVEFRFRNGDKVQFTAQEIKIPELLADVKAYIKTRPNRLDWQKLQISNIGYQILTKNKKKYIGKEVSDWSMELQPRPKHIDARVTVNTNLSKAGAYLVTAKMADGNETNIVLWVSDTAIIKKPMQDKAMYYIADAVTGKPIEKANLELFGYWQEYKQRNRRDIHVKNFAEFTNKDGLVYLPIEDKMNQYQWLATATTKSGRFAYLGFNSIWSANYYNQQYNQTKTFAITDRPVYRPDQLVHFKLWTRHAKYDQEDKSNFAGKSIPVEIYNPKGEKIYEQILTADKYGGVEGELKLAADAILGSYRLNTPNRGHGGINFRVEEYKKPEFEVKIDAPTDPIMLGEKFTAKINAKYYFGSPVTNAKVKYKVLRTSYSGDWYPTARWDWFYGRGYWWFAYDYNWYPGWSNWGCSRPSPWWFWRSPQQPEVIAEAEKEIGEDGTLEIEIDTALAKAVHGNQDHSYQIQAEVVDESRRTIVGNGRVLVARKPFKVFAWVNRGYFRVGDTIQTNFKAHTLDSKPVKGSGELRLLKISYKGEGVNRKPVEAVVQTWDLATNFQGTAKQQIKASEAGQYRLSYKVTDKSDHTIEGGYLFTIIGEGFDGSQFRFNDVELVPEKQEYAPGEKVKLQINPNRAGSTVLLFLRPANGAYQEPRVLHLDGKSTTVELDITKKDMPNFFVEAMTVAHGKAHTENRELYVPPEKRIINVEVLPSKSEYKPGEHATMEVRLTDIDGKPFNGTSVVSIYDKSVEYISGGSNVKEIREFFWKWRRRHQPRSEDNLQRSSYNIVRSGDTNMSNLGVFGGNVVDEMSEGRESDMDMPASSTASFGRRTGGLAKKAAPMKAERSRSVGLSLADGADESKSIEEDSNESLNRRQDNDSPGDLAQPTVRQNFADTALWVGSLTTNTDGIAKIELDMPENLTAWKVRVWSMGHGTKVGQGEAEVVTRKKLILRQQAPRFFVEKDEVVLSANVHNYLDKAAKVMVYLELPGGYLEPMNSDYKKFYFGKDGEKKSPEDAPELWGAKVGKEIEIEAGGEKRVDWRVRVIKEGKTTVRMLALSKDESDAMQQSFPVYVHGMLKMDAYSGALRLADKSGKFTFRIPEERRAEQTRLEVRYSPTLAAAMVDSLPYLIDYPYGCTEQTLNRFLPAVITQKTLQKMGLDLKAIQEKRTNLNAQEIGDDLERAKGWKRFKSNPVFDDAELSKVVKDGVARLTEMQLSDGGWGWFSGWGEHSYPHTTAVVVHGLQVATSNDVALVPGVLDRGVAWLVNYQQKEVAKLQNVDKDGNVINKDKRYKRHADNLDAMIFMVLTDAGKKNNAMLKFLYRDRTKLAAYSLSTYGLALHKLGEQEKLAMVMQNISQFVEQDEENQTAWLNMPGGHWWHWYGSEYEAHAYYLKLLAATNPESKVASRMVKYLLNNRKHATYWKSTRDTALVVEAFADYIKATGEDKPDLTVEIWLDGKKQKEVKITEKDLFTFDNKLVIEGEALSAGEHTIEIKKRGKGPLYYNGYVTNFTLEDFITKAGLELKVERKYYKLVPVEKSIKVAGSRGQALDQKVEKYERKELANNAMLKSGDLVEVELIIESKNDYEYILFEDMKPAGFETVEVRSGYTGNEMHAYVEFRDNRVAMFVQKLARGKHSMSYRMRAEIPGRFSALPTKAHAMYAPELKGNSDEIKLQVQD